ncbi:hypothetical protein SCLCIDRAFT_25838 [Scleroderma citrinum Foug A]|uniref:Hydrophobin n=1 Tax=Scleroderma citrinum Foug A TaxID=1036808 RepID=A0A0C3DLI7_9AGAM|nr:hypothetical protein SCLCIDRAFT_25838 [Scleroderma citrinum Foug A]
MFIRASALLLSVLALSSFAIAGGEGTPSCNGASPQCCQKTYQANQQNAQQLGISEPLQAGQIGDQCTSYTFGGIPNGANCDGSVLCCSKTGVGNNSQVAMGCMPVGIQI